MWLEETAPRLSVVATAHFATAYDKPPLQHVAPRKSTGERNVTGQAESSNETKELSQSMRRARLRVCSNSNSMHARDEMDFRSRASRDMIGKKKSPAKPGLDDRLFLSAHFASLAIACVRRDTLRLALFL